MKRARSTAALIALVLAITVGSALLLRSKANSDEPTAAVPPGERAGDAARPEAAANSRDASRPGEAAKKASEERGRLLETIGCLTSAHYFQTYLNIGFIADARSEGIYSTKDARTVLDSVLSLLNSTDTKLEALAKIELEREDRD